MARSGDILVFNGVLMELIFLVFITGAAAWVVLRIVGRSVDGETRPVHVPRRPTPTSERRRASTRLLVSLLLLAAGVALLVVLLVRWVGALISGMLS